MMMTMQTDYPTTQTVILIHKEESIIITAYSVQAQCSGWWRANVRGRLVTIWSPVSPGEYYLFLRFAFAIRKYN